MKAICVFCSANFNGDPAIAQLIEHTAQTFTDRSITLVYGGARVGMMGMLADAVLQRSGKVIGILPQFLMDKEIAHTSLTELHIVNTMHQRKQMMVDLSDGIIALPGGVGTLDELFEAFTWLQLGLHKSPVGLLNINGFYNPLIQQLDAMVDGQFLKAGNRQSLLIAGDIEQLVIQMESFTASPQEVWFKK